MNKKLNRLIKKCRAAEKKGCTITYQISGRLPAWKKRRILANCASIEDWAEESAALIDFGFVEIGMEPIHGRMVRFITRKNPEGKWEELISHDDVLELKREKELEDAFAEVLA